MRQQENGCYRYDPRCCSAQRETAASYGLWATTGTQTNEGHGFGAQGVPDEAAGALVEFRLAADAGNYHRVGELSANSGADELNASYTLAGRGR